MNLMTRPSSFDHAQLLECGHGKLFGPGTPTTELVDYIKDWFASRESEDAAKPGT